MLELKLQYFGHLMWRADSFEKTLMVGKTEGGRRRDNRGWDRWMASLTQWTWVWVNSGSWWWTGRPGVLWFMESQIVRHNWATGLNWADMRILLFFLLIALCFICLCSRRAEAQCSRNGGGIYPYSQVQSPLSVFEVSLWSCPFVLTGLDLLGEQSLKY